MRTSNLIVVAVLAGCAAGGGSESAGGSPWGSGLPGGSSGAADDAGNGGGEDDGAGPGGGTEDGGDDAADEGSSSSDSTGTWEPDPDGPAFLHADVWSTFWNDRTRCGAEVTFLEICQRRGEADCAQYEAAVGACDPNMIVYGQVGPEQQGNELCSRGNHPDIGGCVASSYDFDTLRFNWYGAEWQGNWPIATIKIFEQGADWTGGGELIAFSNLPGHGQAAMSGIDNHGLGYGCAMQGATSGDEAYQSRFGGFAWIEVPVGEPVTVVSAAATNFADQQFQGCSRGSATQDPWVTAPPGAELGCVHLVDITFEAGHHYYLQYGQVTELAAPGPPAELVAAFEADVTTEAGCML